MGKRQGALLVLLVLGAAASVRAQYDIETRLPRCTDLQWSEAVHRSYPDIDQVCRGVYQKDGVLYAMAQVEVIRVVGNRLTIRTVHSDGSPGHQASMRTGSDWRATIEGKQYRVGELLGGQILTVYLPEDRFAFAQGGDQGVAEHSADDTIAEDAPVPEK